MDNEIDNNFSDRIKENLSNFLITLMTNHPELLLDTQLGCSFVKLCLHFRVASFEEWLFYVISDYLKTVPIDNIFRDDSVHRKIIVFFLSTALDEKMNHEFDRVKHRFFSKKIDYLEIIKKAFDDKVPDIVIKVARFLFDESNKHSETLGYNSVIIVFIFLYFGSVVNKQAKRTPSMFSASDFNDNVRKMWNFEHGPPKISVVFVDGLLNRKETDKLNKRKDNDYLFSLEKKLHQETVLFLSNLYLLENKHLNIQIKTLQHAIVKIRCPDLPVFIRTGSFDPKNGHNSIVKKRMKRTPSDLSKFFG